MQTSVVPLTVAVGKGFTITAYTVGEAAVQLLPSA